MAPAPSQRDFGSKLGGTLWAKGKVKIAVDSGFVAESITGSIKSRYFFILSCSLVELNQKVPFDLLIDIFYREFSAVTT